MRTVTEIKAIAGVTAGIGKDKRANGNRQCLQRLGRGLRLRLASENPCDVHL